MLAWPKEERSQKIDNLPASATCVGLLLNNYPIKPCSTLSVTSHCTLRKKKIVFCVLARCSASAERVGQGKVGGVNRRVLSTWWLLGLVLMYVVYLTLFG